MNYSYLRYFLPEALLEHFIISEVKELGDIKTKKMFLELHLEEKNHLPKGYTKGDYESKGFLSSKQVQDFPVRGKAVYLQIKTRRWRHKQTKQEISNDYSFIAEGSKLTVELSNFLKATGRDPRRYHQ